MTSVAAAVLGSAPWSARSLRRGLAIFAFAALAACSGRSEPPPAALAGASDPPAEEYKIAANDTVQIFVWRAPDLSVTVPVRPDGRISAPLIGDVGAAGRTAKGLAGDIAGRLKEYVNEPVVNVMVTRFSEPAARQIKVVGEVLRPVAVPYRPDMTVMDVIVNVGGLSQFAAGNRAILVRGEGKGRHQYRLRLDDLLRGGDVSADVPVLPGDSIIVPRSML